MGFDSIDDVYQFLDNIPSFKAKGKGAADFSLDRFRQFCDAIGNPQDKFPSIHVAGSNGKGSTCTILGSIYRAADFNVGVYTSPHLISYNERFAINGQIISDGDLMSFFEQHQSRIKSFRLTYFEISTALAFWWFAEQDVEIAVIETGLGGRLDSTNIINPIASVITTVTLDHTDVLGNSLEAIAAEKAGIIKQNTPVVLGNMPQVARQVIREYAKAKSAPVYTTDEMNPKMENGRFYLNEGGQQVELESTLRASVQAWNIAAAWRATTVLQDKLPITDAQRKNGIYEAGGRANTARFEKLHPALQWYFDGAHNLQAIREMKKMVRQLQPIDKSTVVFAIMEDKLNKKMASEFSEFQKIIYHTLPLGRAAAFQDVQKLLPRVQAFPNRSTERNSLLKEIESELVIFTGSFYFYPTVRDWLSKLEVNQ